jgi:lactoylglutathione lyase
MADEDSALEDANNQDPSILLNLFVIRAVDLEAARAFYSSLGLVLKSERHGTGPEHYAAEVGSAVFEIFPARESTVRGAVRIGFEVPSLDAVVDLLRRQSATIVTEPHDSPWGRRAVVEDPDGNRVELTEQQ